MKDASPKDVADELPEAMPRLILHRHAVEIEAGVAPRDFLFYIHYNPFDCPADMKRLYASARDLVLDKYTELKKFSKQVELNNADDFNPVWYKTKVLGLQGQAGKALPGQRSTGGYDGRM